MPFVSKRLTYNPDDPDLEANSILKNVKLESNKEKQSSLENDDDTEHRRQNNIDREVSMWSQVRKWLLFF